MIFNRLHNKLEQTSIQTLNKNDVFGLKGSRAGQLINCLDGEIWITQQGDGFDWILSAGEKFHTRLPGKVVAEALKDSRIKVTPQKKAGLVEHHPFLSREEICCPC